MAITSNINLVKSELPTLTHHPVAKAQDSAAANLLSFLVVGDWGRKGTYNQSEVAFQVHYSHNSSVHTYIHISNVHKR